MLVSLTSYIGKYYLPFLQYGDPHFLTVTFYLFVNSVSKPKMASWVF